MEELKQDFKDFAKETSECIDQLAKEIHTLNTELVSFEKHNDRAELLNSARMTKIEDRTTLPKWVPPTILSLFLMGITNIGAWIYNFAVLQSDVKYNKELILARTQDRYPGSAAAQDFRLRDQRLDFQSDRISGNERQLDFLKELIKEQDERIDDIEQACCSKKEK